MNSQFPQQDDFFDASELDNLDREIADQIGRPTLVDQMQEQSDAEEARRMNWSSELKKHWYVYAFLLLSAVFTATLGIYMGLSPTLQTDATGLTYIHFNTDVGHVLLAFVYCLAFVGVTEFQFAVAKQKFYTREQKNQSQKWTMIIGMVVGVIGIMGTGLAGGVIVASNIMFLTEFADIPPSAQKWVVIVIPLMFAIYTVLYTIYALSSEEAKAERLASENERKQNLDHRTRMRSIEQIATRQLQVAEIMVYKQMVMAGKLSSAEAAAAIRAGRTLAQTEAVLGRDLDGDHSVGTTRRLPPPLPAQRVTEVRGTNRSDPYSDHGLSRSPAPIHPTPPHPHVYTLAEFLEFLAYTPQQALNLIDTYTNDDAGAWKLLNGYEMIPVDMTFENFRALYGELHTYPTLAARPQNGQKRS
jgi:hypothetical protein